MNKLGQYMTIVGGGLIVGALTYLVADYILYKKSEEGSNGPQEKGEETIITLDEVNKVDNMNKFMPIGETSKPALSELVRHYIPDPVKMEDVQIKIVPYSSLNNHPDVEVESIYYYSGDQVYTYLDDSIIEDPTELLGPNIHLHLGEGSGDPNKVYVWNGFLKTFFEITQIDDAYKYVVMGQPRALKVKPKRIRKAAPKKKEELADEVYDEDTEGDPADS